MALLYVSATDLVCGDQLGTLLRRYQLLTHRALRDRTLRDIAPCHIGAGVWPG